MTTWLIGRLFGLGALVLVVDDDDVLVLVELLVELDELLDVDVELVSVVEVELDDVVDVDVVVGGGLTTLLTAVSQPSMCALIVANEAWPQEPAFVIALAVLPSSFESQPA